MKYILVMAVMLLPTLISAQNIKLPEPNKEGGMPLMQALDLRQTSRDYSTQELSKQQLSDLLWAAFGYNRDDQKKHTAPSSMNHQEIQIYVLLSSGVYLYDAKKHILNLKQSQDLRALSGKQDFVKTAPLNLVYVANYADNEAINKENWLHYSYANVGFIAQNVYLFCASEGLGTVVRGWFDTEELHKALHLLEENVVILAQTVGIVK